MPGPLSRPKSSFSNSVIALSIVIADNRGSYRGSLMNPEEGESNRVFKRIGKAEHLIRKSNWINWKDFGEKCKKKKLRTSGKENEENVERGRLTETG